jgi:predicted transcriptional regulator
LSGVEPLAAGVASSYTNCMEVQFTPDIEARLAERAARERLDPHEVVQEVIARYFLEEDRFLEAVKRGECALESGEHLTHEDVGERLRRFLEP